MLHALVALTALACLPVLAQVCAPPGLLLNALPGGIINDYYDGSNQATLNPGANSLTLGVRDARGYTTTFVVGDLLMIMQMQDGVINSANSNSYGDGSGGGNGASNVGNAGLYEYVRVTSNSAGAVGTAGATIGFTPKLTNQYFYANATATTSQKRYQIIKVLQFSAVTTTQTIKAPPWNGLTGGIAALDVRDTLTLVDQPVGEGGQNAAIFVAGKGFNGGFTITTGTSNAQTYSPADYARNSGNGSASKGEGILGTPRFTSRKLNGWGFRTTNPAATASDLTSSTLAFEGYPGGSYGIGAPGNAGGGGMDGTTAASTNQFNAGGGGGGNYGPGGLGGRPWNFPLVDSGGRGGAGYAGTLAFNRVFLGGGGGAGDTNNSTNDAAVYTNNGMSCSIGAGYCSSGAAGGGVVLIRARNIVGSGTIDARGAHGYNVSNDAAGGGGAGGSVIIETPNGGNARVDVTGGDGGNAWAGSTGWPGNRHGPGGAGGGGFVAYAPNTMAVTAIIDGGAPGQTMSDSATAGGPAIEYYGSSGFNGGLINFLAPNVPGVPQAALCDPNLQLSKSNGVTSLVSPGTFTYTVTIANLGNSDSFGTVTVADKLPAGLTVTPGPLAVGGVYAAQWACTAANSTDIICTSTATIPAINATTPPSNTRSFSFNVSLSAANGTSIINRAQVSGGGDPLKTTTATPVTAATCTGTNTPIAGCALDSDTVLAPSLSLTKDDGLSQLTPSYTVTYTLTVNNAGGAPTPGPTGTVTVVDWLPTGLTYSGITPFTSGNFTCTVVGQGITCERTLAIAASSSAAITFSAVVGTQPPSAVINRAQVGGGGDPSPLKSAAPTTTTAAACADPVAPATSTSDPNNGCATDADSTRYVRLDLAKDDGQVYASNNGIADYQFTLRNIGTIPTVGTLSMTDVLPGLMTFPGGAGATFNPTGTNGANWTCTNSQVTVTSCISTTVIPAGGKSVFTIRANVGNPGAGVSQLNRSRVSGGGDVTPGMLTAGGTPTVANVQACSGDGNPAGCAIDLNVTQASAEIRITKSHPDPQNRSVGSTFIFALNITNTGGTAAALNTVRMVDSLPTGMTVTSITVSGTPYTCTTATAAITCNNTSTTVAASSASTITIGVSILSPASNPFINRAQVGTNGSDPQNATFPTTVTAATCLNVGIPLVGCATDSVPLDADLQIFKQQRLGSTGAFQSTPLGVSINDTVQFQIQVVNTATGPTVTGVTFTDQIPNNFSSVATVSAVASGGATGCAVTNAGNLVTGSATTLPGGSTCTFLIGTSATANATGVTNTAVVNIPSGINDTNSANNSSSVVTAIGSANLTVVKTNGLSSVGAGSTISYTLTVANFGPSAAPGTVLTDGAATGLNCTAVSCTAFSGSACPTAGSTTMAYLQGTGIVTPSLPANSSVAYVVTCGVTATGK